MVGHSYTKAAGISFLIHGVLLGFLFMLGQMMISPITAAQPIEVECIEAISNDAFDKPEVISTEVSQQEVNPSAAAASPTAVKLIAEQTRGTAANYPQGAAVLNQSYSGAATASINSAAARPIQNQAQGTVSAPQKTSVRTNASCISRSRPPYPREALANDWEGNVVVRVLITKNGSPSAVTVRKSSGYQVLDQAAVASIKNWRFSPACQDGSPIESYYDVKMKFDLAEAEAE